MHDNVHSQAKKILVCDRMHDNFLGSLKKENILNLNKNIRRILASHDKYAEPWQMYLYPLCP